MSGGRGGLFGGEGRGRKGIRVARGESGRGRVLEEVGLGVAGWGRKGEVAWIIGERRGGIWCVAGWIEKRGGRAVQVGDGP